MVYVQCLFVTGDLGKALYRDLQSLSPDNALDGSGLLEIVRNGQTHVLATGRLKNSCLRIMPTFIKS